MSSRKLILLIVAGSAFMGCGGATTADYTVAQAASDMAADLPTAPFLDHAYDTCVASYLFQHRSPDEVKTIIRQDLVLAGLSSVLTAAEKNCVSAGSGL